MDFIKSFHIFNKILMVLSLALYKYDCKTKKYQSHFKYLLYGGIYSMVQFCACFTIMWHIEISYYVCSSISVLSFTEFVRIFAVLLSSLVIVILAFVNSPSQTKLFNAFLRFDCKLYEQLSHKINYNRVHSIFMNELLVWSIYFFVFVTIITQLTFSYWDTLIALWVLAYAFFANVVGVTYFFILFSKRHIDLRFHFLVQELNRIVQEFSIDKVDGTKECRLVEELSSVYELLSDLAKFKRLFKASFGALLSYLILNDMFSVIVNLFYIIYACMHGDELLLFKFDSYLLDFVSSKGATCLRLFYFVRNVSLSNGKEVRHFNYIFICYFVVFSNMLFYFCVCT